VSGSGNRWSRLLAVVGAIAALAASVLVAPAAAGGSDPTVVAVGDIACDPASAWFNDGAGTATKCRQMDTSTLALSLDPDAVLALGDLQYDCGGYAAFLRSYDPSWGRLKALTHPVPGNHEYDTTGATDCSPTPTADGYFRYFGAAAGDPGEGWYSFDVGTWHVVALNSNCAEIGGCTITSPQGGWLQADLAADDATCTLAYMHAPRFSSGTHGNIASMGPFWQLLHADGADVVLAGHDHGYERFAPLDPNQQADPAGIRSFVVGTGGKNLRETYPSAQPGSEVRIGDRFGVLELTLRDGAYDWAFAPTTGEPPLDAGTGTCR
jgi:acid phosphatase type 7